VTHGIARVGAAGAAALSLTQIGTDIVLPAGGPWLIHGIWAQAIQDTAVANEAVNGDIIIDSASGDIEPDPAPGIYPCAGINAASSANFASAATPLNIYTVNWQAPGKAAIKLSFRNLSGNATAPRVACGIIFSDNEPVIRPQTFVDRVALPIAAAGDNAIGSMVLAEKASRLTGIMATMRKDGAVVVDEGMIGFVRLDSADVKLTPAEFPFDIAISAADGTLAGALSSPRSQFIPLDFDVVGGCIINVTGVLDQAVTNGIDASVYLAYE
jgi:hypothetical protein